MGLKIYDLTVNYLENPLAIDKEPRFSFKVVSDKKGDKGAKTRIRVYSSTENILNNYPDMWDSGYMENADSVLVHYEGKKLSPVKKYFWTAECVSEAGYSEISDVAFFVTGKLKEPFFAKWISAKKAGKNTVEASYLRKEFDVSGDVESAYLTICGLGYFESFVNGKKTGDDILSPAFTAYDKDDMYMQYDIKDLITNGKNAIGVVLGNGFYNSFTADRWADENATWRNFSKLISEIKITYKDGRSERIISDTSWKSTVNGPITFNGIRNGEYYDANLELGDFSCVGYDDSAWESAKISKSPGGVMRAQEMEPIRIRRKFPAVKKWKGKNGWIFDIGQNIAGFGEYNIYGKKDTTAVFRYSDILTEENELDFDALSCFVNSGEFQTDKYTKKSDGKEHFMPSFVYHGFQYIEVSGIDYEPELSDIVGVAVCTDVKEIGHFSCSDEMLNKLQHLCRWSTLSNLESFPTDNPHREKNGWTGDTMASCEQMLTNFGTRSFMTKWSGDIRSSQRPAGQIPCVVPSTGWGYYGLMGPDWSAAMISVPYYVYLYNGDRDVLLENYEAIKKNIEFMLSMTEDHTLNYGTGDWCAPFIGPALGKNMGSYKCPVEVSDTGFLYNAAKKAEKMASIFGNVEEKEYYGDLAATVKNVFREKFFDKETYTVKGDCQTATGVMLFFGLYDNDEEKNGLVKRLIEQIEEKDFHVDFGVLGCKFVMHTLGAEGHGDIGTRMISQKTFPGVAEWISRGATTLWECWNGGGSHNHHMFSDLSAFMYKYIAGISPDEDEPGFKHVIFRPAFDSGLESASASHDSMIGKAECDWTQNGDSASLSLTVPFGAHGTLYLPYRFAGKIKEDGKVLDCRVENGKAVYELLSGNHILKA